MIVAIFGLGEAGSHYAEGLMAIGHTVRGYDPFVADPPTGVQRSGSLLDCHALRRSHEPDSAAEHLTALGVEPIVTTARRTLA